MLSLLLSVHCICSPLAWQIDLRARTASITAQAAAPQLVRSFYKYYDKLDKCASEKPIKGQGCSCCGLNRALRDFRFLLGVLPKQSVQEIAPCILSLHQGQARRIRQAPVPNRLSGQEAVLYRKELRKVADELMKLGKHAILKHGIREAHESNCRVRSSPQETRVKDK